MIRIRFNRQLLVQPCQFAFDFVLTSTVRQWTLTALRRLPGLEQELSGLHILTLIKQKIAIKIIGINSPWIDHQRLP